MFVVGGLIVGNPDDTRESIEANLAFARQYVDWPYIQHPTPYPAHADDRGLPGPWTHRRRGRQPLRRHDGRRAQRARAGARHRVPALAGRAMDEAAPPAGGVLPQPRGSSCGTASRCCAHTFAGTTLRSLVGLESARVVFERFRHSRRQEREALTPGADALAARSIPARHESVARRSDLRSLTRMDRI